MNRKGEDYKVLPYSGFPLFLLFLLLIFGAISPSAAQEQSENESGNIPTLEEAPGIFLDTNAGSEETPSLSELPGTPESGFVEGQTLQEGQTGEEEFNTARIWRAGATPDEIVKVGDITNSELEAFISVSDLTISDIAGDAETNVEDVPLSDIDLLNNQTLGQFLETFPEYNDQEVSNLPILSETFGNLNEVSSEAGTLSNDEILLAERLREDQRFSNISLSELSNGDFGDNLSEQEQETLARISENNPELGDVPVNRLFSEENQEWTALFRETEQSLGEGEIQNLTTSELLEANPELADAPLSAFSTEELTIGDIEGLSEESLGNFSGIEDQYLSDLGNLSENSDSLLNEENLESLLNVDSSSFGAGNLPGDVVARIDIPFAGETEKHFEIVDLFPGAAGFITGLGEVQGKGWVQGSSQSVPGGQGALIAVNGGMERTGVSVWTPQSHTKLSLENIDEGGNGVPSTASIWLDFQICVPTMAGEQCTPHFLTIPTPFMIQAGSVMLVFSQTSPSELIEQGLDSSSGSSDEGVELPASE